MRGGPLEPSLPPQLDPGQLEKVSVLEKEPVDLAIGRWRSWTDAGSLGAQAARPSPLPPERLLGEREDGELLDTLSTLDLVSFPRRATFIAVEPVKGDRTVAPEPVLLEHGCSSSSQIPPSPPHAISLSRSSQPLSGAKALPPVPPTCSLSPLAHALPLTSSQAYQPHSYPTAFSYHPRDQRNH